MRHPILAALLLTTALTACSGGRQVGNEEYGTDNARERILRGGGVNPTNAGLVVFGVDRNQQTEQGGPGAMRVNAYLWRATLETLSSMPFASVDPFGGVIITDWYSHPTADGERVKVQAYVLGGQLRSDGVRVQVFRQIYRNGQWVDQPASSATNSEMEDRVLAAARELRTQTTASR